MSTRYLQLIYPLHVAQLQTISCSFTTCQMTPSHQPQYQHRHPLLSPSEEVRTTTSTTQISHATTQPTKAPALLQIDGGSEYHPTRNPNFAQSNTPSYPRQQRTTQPPLHARSIPIALSLPVPPPPPLHQQSHATGNTVRDLLPYCTTEPPLNEAQVIALSDVVGSLGELVPLALAAAAGEERSVRKLETAVGKRDAVSVVEFFVDEWEIEG